MGFSHVPALRFGCRINFFSVSDFLISLFLFRLCGLAKGTALVYFKVIRLLPAINITDSVTYCHMMNSTGS